MDANLARYEYIARLNPNGAFTVLDKYGYTLQGDNIQSEEVGLALEDAVAQGGLPALTDIMSQHPDKGIIVELFGTATSGSCTTCVTAALKAPLTQGNNNCNPCNGNGWGGSKGGVNQFLSNPTNVLLLGIGIVLAVVVLKS